MPTLEAPVTTLHPTTGTLTTAMLTYIAAEREERLARDVMNAAAQRKREAAEIIGANVQHGQYVHVGETMFQWTVDTRQTVSYKAVLDALRQEYPSKRFDRIARRHSIRNERHHEYGRLKPIG